MSTFDLKTAALAARKEKREYQDKIAAEQARQDAEERRQYIEQASAFWEQHLGADFLAALGTPERPEETDEDGRHDLTFRTAGQVFTLIRHTHDEAYISGKGSSHWVPYTALRTTLLELIGEWLEDEEQLRQVNAGMKDLLHSDEPERYFWLDQDLGAIRVFANHGNIARSLASLADLEYWLNEHVAPIITAAKQAVAGFRFANEEESMQALEQQLKTWHEL